MVDSIIRSGKIGSMITLYGITNCDTVKKARAWLDDEGVEYRFHDFKKHGVPTDRLAHWLRDPGWEALLNRKGTTWRQLEPDARAAAVDEAGAKALMLAHPTLIKRPVVEWGNGITVGFAPEDWAERST